MVREELLDRRRLLMGGVTALTSITFPKFSNAQEPVQQSENTSKQEKNSPLKQIARPLIPSNIALTMQMEDAEYNASAVFVETPPALIPLLHPDEVLAITVSHNFRNWTDACKLTGTMFWKLDAELTPQRSRHYSARLINRFQKVDLKSKDVDFAIICLRVPDHRDREYIRSIVRPVAPAGQCFELGTTAVLVGCPGLSKGTPVQRKPRNSPLEREPNTPEWRDARLVQCQDTFYPTQYGNVKCRHMRTIANSAPGQSGGGLYNAKGQLIGLCSTGASVPLNTIDFEPKGSQKLVLLPPGGSSEGFDEDRIITHSEEEFNQKNHELAMSTADWAMNSGHRNTCISTELLDTLASYTAAEYNALLVERQKVCQLIAKHTQGSPRGLRRALVEKTERTQQLLKQALEGRIRSLKVIDEDLAKFKPRR